MANTIHADLNLEKVLKNEKPPVRVIAPGPLQAMRADLTSVMNLPSTATDASLNVQRQVAPKKIPKLDAHISDMRANAPELLKDLGTLTGRGVTPA